MRLREVQPTHPAVEPVPDYHLTHAYRYNVQLVSQITEPEHPIVLQPVNLCDLALI